MKNQSLKAQGLIAINLAAVIFGSAALFGKLDVSPFWIVDMRALFAAMALFVFGFFKRENLFPLREHWMTIFTTSVILAIHWITFFASVQKAGVAIATLTFATFPLITVFIETVHQRRKPHLLEIMAGLAIILAVGLLINPQSGQNNLMGIFCGLASAISFAWFGHASKQLGKVLSPLQVSFAQNAVVAFLLIPFILFLRPYPVQPMDWFWLFMLGVFTTALMHQLYFYALKRLSASTCSGFVALEPVYAIAFAALIFHERITPWVFLSMILILGASFILLKTETMIAAKADV